MKKLIFITFSLLFVITYSIKAQTLPRKCGTMEHLEMQKAADPMLEVQINDLEAKMQKWIDANYDEIMASKSVITIPVVVHIVYKATAENISDARVLEQINVLNNDYAGLNLHSMGSFSSTLKINTELQFCLAQRKPDGSATNGIERRATTVTSFTSNDNVKKYSKGGLDAWDPTKYMNIWVCNLGGGLCGYAQFPTTGVNSTYGVVINYQYFGCTGAVAPYNLGGSTTHEIGHCFNLYHIWGDDNGACTGTDNCGDSPNQANYTFGAHTGVLTDACTTTSPGIMYMNFMDYSDDISYANFTPDQKARIQACFTAGGLLYSLTTSNACTPPTTGCGDPSGLSVPTITSNSAIISWSAVTGASSYNIQIKQSSGSTWTTSNVTTTSASVTNLLAFTQYDFQVQAVCQSGTSNYVSTSFITLAASNCIDNYEPNETSTAAVAITVNTPITALISSSTDVDWFKFTNTQSTKNIRITLTNLPADYDILLYAPNGSLAGHSKLNGTSNEVITKNKGTVGTYYIKVYPKGSSFSATTCYTLTAFTSGSAFKEIDSEINGNYSLNIFPNPAQNNVTLAYTVDFESYINITIIDLAGRTTKQFNYNTKAGTNNYDIDLSGFNNGFYFVKLTDGNNTITQKMIISK